MKIYNKLVRDKIPDIILNRSGMCDFEILDSESFRIALNTKLLEEVNEYINDEKEEELADILEVIDCIVKTNGFSFEKILSIKANKKELNGCFDRKIFLRSVNL